MRPYLVTLMRCVAANGHAQDRAVAQLFVLNLDTRDADGLPLR
jgi:hypothetical protein